MFDLLKIVSNRKKVLFISLFIFRCSSLFSQEYLYPLNRDMETRIASFINEDTTGFHTAMKPYTVADLKRIAPLDSVWEPITGNGKFYNTWVGRKIFKEHLVAVNEDDIILAVDPVFNVQVG